MEPTAGPWKMTVERSGIEIRPEGPPYFTVRVPYPRRGASRGMPVQFSPTGCEEPAARLIASAPDLLQAAKDAEVQLSALFEAFESGAGTWSLQDKRVVVALREAIAKAEGR